MHGLDRWRNHPVAAALGVEVETALAAWDARGNSRRLWQRDATLWTGGDESRWLGWLDIVSQQLANLDPLLQFQADVRQAGFKDALLLGMGGSSLCPEVMASILGSRAGFPRLHVLDSTDPAQVLDFESRVDPRSTLYIVASKSGTTLEPAIFKAYFMASARRVLGDDAPRHFVAITDPGSKLEQEAQSEGFRAIFQGVPGIGGRYSALSNFGMVPAAALGLDVQQLLHVAQEMVQACGADRPAAANPGVALGVLLGVLGKRGRDKITFIAAPEVAPLGGWLEQLIAESTGKAGHGLIPIDREQVAVPAAYGSDRLFVLLKLESTSDTALDTAVEALEHAGQPVVHVTLPSPQHLTAEFFRWEMATAVAGALLGIHPFDQPDVEASKIETRALTTAYERSGSLPAEKPFFEAQGVRLFADAAIAAGLERMVGTDRTLASFLRVHLARIGRGDYCALLAYLQMNAAHDALLQSMRHDIRDVKKAATCLGFGPRFLHSTGQAYKGGPNTGVFLQITCDDGRDVPVPGARYTFGVVKAAQARGDFQVLAARERRALRVHLGQDVEAGLQALKAAVSAALDTGV